MVIRYRMKIKKISDLQLYTVAGLLNVGQVLAEKLLKYFGTVRRIYFVSREELIKVEKWAQK